MPDLSVIICAHNSQPDCLRRTLESLAAQTFPKERWELLIVDNASQSPLAEHCDISWHPHGRHFREDRLGIAFARLCGINNSTGQLLVFVDDDNVLAPDYLAKAVDLAARYPHLAVLGAGILEPEFKIQPPEKISKFLGLLALRSVSAPRWSNNPQDSSCLPFGAGMCVRRQTADQLIRLFHENNIAAVLDRKGDQLFSHGDDLFSWAAAASGEGFGIFPELKIVHLISAGRLNQKYFLRLIYFSSISHWVLHYLLAGDEPKKIGFFRIVHVFLHGLKNGIFSARCQWMRAKGEDYAVDFIAEKKLQPAKSARSEN